MEPTLRSASKDGLGFRATRENFPDGEVFTGPIETKVDGTISFTYPSSYAGRRISGVRPRVPRRERSSARTPRKVRRSCARCWALDEGARRGGEFAFGLNEAP